MRKWNVSHSQIMRFRKCPYDYAMLYKYNMEPIMFDPSVFEVGRRVHDTIDTYYKQYYKTDTTEEEILDVAYNTLRSNWDVLLPANLLGKSYTCLKNFAEFEMQNIEDGVLTQPNTETRIVLEKENIMGKPDYRNCLRKGGDFKTSAKAGISYADKLQAGMYYMLLESIDLGIDEYTLYYLYPNDTRDVPFKDEYVDDILDYKNQILNAWEHDKFPKEPRTKGTCNSCGFKHYCGGVEWKNI